MLKTHEKFHSANGKRLILIVDDEEINRELLDLMLCEDYETIQASDGEQALSIIREKADVLSLVLLDLLMPGMHGLDLIKILKNDQELKHIPVIVLTADQEAEVTSLQLGASDFIPKPYPKPEVVLTRVVRTIELSEDRDIIQSTERDALTGLYNREYFYRYAQQFDQHHKELVMDAIVLDVHHFRMINERYGKSYGDDVLRRIGDQVRRAVRDTGGIVCRREADTFLVYCPHRTDYGDILESASVSLDGGSASANRVRLRMGVYARVDKSIEMERRFDRAKMAADTVRSNFVKSIALYDERLHESEIYAEQLLEGFQDALSQHQFAVHFQPKFDIRPDRPVLASAEALVRWMHPVLGMISPGVFIPLFEENGLIQQLDIYVWQQTAAQIRDWKDRLGISVPVSVNVSRIDMYDPNLITTLRNLLTEYDLTPGELLLEITESAYTQDSAQIIDTVSQLRELGFRIEMDDFGTGYSSLNMISSLPIDALKLDMRFIRDAFRDGHDTRLIEVIIDIADYLSVPVIAEGVETQEQLDALKALGCDMVQGYFFSKPLPASEYEFFLEQKKQQETAPDSVREGTVLDGAPADTSAASGDRAAAPDSVTLKEQLELERALEETRKSSLSYARIAQALSRDYYSIYIVNTDTDEFIEYSSSPDYQELQVEQSGVSFFEDCRRNILRLVYKDDLDLALSVWDKNRLMPELEGGRTFSSTYRLMMDGVPVYINCKVIRMESEQDRKYIVIGVSNVDTQIRRERELNAIREKANRDALTGVKSKHAYVDATDRLNEEIRSESAEPFAVAVCDVNGLKTVNDTRGHQAGDQLILDAAHVICQTFKHSPVFRIGGDEFVAILKGSDYEQRSHLQREMEEKNRQSRVDGRAVVACGTAVWMPGSDGGFEDVFARADAAMYENKAALKSGV